MESSSGTPNVVAAPAPQPSAGDLILQQRTQAVQNAQQSAQNGDGSLFSQLTSNPLFTAVRVVDLETSFDLLTDINSF